MGSTTFVEPQTAAAGTLLTLRAVLPPAVYVYLHARLVDNKHNVVSSTTLTLCWLSSGVESFCD